jgi:hypothetical protein
MLVDITIFESVKRGVLTMADWQSFLHVADEWLIGYAIPPCHSVSVKLFMIGHALELYLKAVIAKQSGSVEPAIRFGHDIKKMWDDCKRKDPNFMNGYDMRDSIFNAMPLSPKTVLSASDRLHLSENIDLYLISVGLADWKYMGTVTKSKKMPVSFATGFPNHYWIAFFKSLRSYLSYPMAGDYDKIRIRIDHFRDLPADTVWFLEQLYS